mgnify:CR=1 FL=1
MKRLVIGLLWFSLSSLAAAGQPPPASAPAVDIGRAMDQKLDSVTITGRELPAVLDELGRRVGVRITLDDWAAELLPWGRQTKLADMTLRNASLREALPQILEPLGLTYELRSGGLVVVATKPLKRMNRRANWDDLRLLQKCRETAFTPEAFAELRIEYRITSKVDAPSLLRKQMEQAGKGTIAQMLEVATGSLGWVWFPDEDHLVIRTAEAQIANQLARRVSLRFERAPLSRILLHLADQAEVPLLLEPGLMQKLPPTTAQNYTLVLENTSIRQALNVISAETGLKYELRRDLLFIGLPDDYRAPGDPPAPRRTAAVVGRISVPSKDGGYTFDLLVREDELPQDVLDYRRQLIEEYIERMRQELGDRHGGSTLSETPPSPPRPVMDAAAGVVPARQDDWHDAVDSGR